MRRRRRTVGLVVLVLVSLSAGAGFAVGCSATDGERPGGNTTGGGGAAGASSTSSSSGMGGEGGENIFIPDAGGDVSIDVPINPCGTACGPEELCDDVHLGLDDDCDGQADEDCPCSGGQVHSCFLGDPSYRDTAGCFPGSEKCSENGDWGPCLGGVHATQFCFVNDKTSCHAITSAPFLTTDLKNGTGDFSADAVPGTEMWTVQCPDGVSPCPGSMGSNFKPLQSGEYTVTYTKGLPGGGTSMCTYPLFVGAPGLRVELTWEHDLGGDGVDLDLHVHQPKNQQPWGMAGVAQDCSWSNCTLSDFTFPSIDTPNWFPPNGMPPNPVSWYKDPVFEKNNCYFAPRGVGQDWQIEGQGCHSPRLDLDNINCNALVTDPDNTDFCAPENINVDFPPKLDWFRIGVHYFSNHDKSYDVHPKVRVFCDGALTAELGPQGYYDPETPITFTPGDGSGATVGNRFWMVADVAFRKDGGQCAAKGCVVKPLYSNPVARTPVLTYDDVAEANFGPPYPPPAP